MIRMNILDELERNVETSIKQDGEKFAKEHSKYGFWMNPFSGHNMPLSSEIGKLFVGRRSEMNDLINLFVKGFLGKGDDVAIIAPKGFGCRSLINLFNNFIYSLNRNDISPSLKKLNDKFGELIEFEAHNITEQHLKELRRKIENSLISQKIIVVTSSFNSGINIAEESSKFSNVEKFRKLLEMDERSKESAFFYPLGMFLLGVIC
jgi:hypothetical protein